MGGLYSRQNVIKRRYLPHINTRQVASVQGGGSVLGGGVLKVLKYVFNAIGVFLLFIVRKVFNITKKLLSGLFDIIRFNPLVHKIAIFSCLTAFVTGAVFLVYYAVISPELPPGNLISTIMDISENQKSINYNSSHVVLSSDGIDWAELTYFDDKEFETGAGSPTQDRSIDIEYTVRPGETLSEIAYAYGISYDFLAWYNKITNANRIRVGTVITIPSLENIEINEPEYKQQKTRQKQTVAAAKTVRNIEISYESRSYGSGTGITVHFSIVNPPSKLKSYEWDLGDGRRSFRDSPIYEYTTPRTYVVQLTAQDESGAIYKSNHLYIDIPYPASAAEHSTTVFITLSSPDEYFVVNGTIKKISRYANVEDAVDLSESDNILTKVRFKKSGYYGVTVQEKGGREQYYSVFVSPIPTMHVDVAANIFNWYRTQFNSGTASNCGPASASMAISWGTGRYFPVAAVRQAIGWQGNGGTSFDELLRVIINNGVNASIQPLKTTQDIRDVIDSGAIAIVLFYTDGVKKSRGDPAVDLLGRYYNDSVGHYIVIKGYSLNGDYFVVHDPIPSDWGANSFRYADEISMMGRNRYFSSAELLRSLRRSEMIVAHGKGW
jgi:murein DD-endopeptidase MepM/ murein hydrolase activator NlpD